MDLRDSPEDATFRAEARSWLEANLTGQFALARGLGYAGSQHEGRDVRMAWERHLGEAGWTCVGWPASSGGRGATMSQQVIWNEEYVRAGGPARVGVMGEGLLGPTLIAYGTEEQKRRFLDPIRLGTEFWCQGYSEPGAGSDLAGLQTRAVLDGDEWVVSGQKVWTSYAQWSQWCFVLCRTDPDSTRHHGLSYLLVPMDQEGIEVRPIRQIMGTSEFNEVFFDGARTSADMVVGEVDDGWRVALATLAFERGAGLLGDILQFNRQLDEVIETAQKNGRVHDPVIRQRLADAWGRLYVLRLNVLRSLTGIEGPVASPQSSIAKLFWANWHRGLGELALDVEGTEATVAGVHVRSAPGHPGAEPVADGADAYEPYLLTEAQRIFLFSRAETIYGGSNEIQRNIIGERVLGLPPEPKAPSR
ncbi:MAG TPA: acyl-CoA dehydrogenase family protein [Acidimicrobiales bacterium]|nr:acyl-CoA dehydrogenase family protein [Acidimicrobiales bacterium]